jgi:DUF1680 family protein
MKKSLAMTRRRFVTTASAAAGALAFDSPLAPLRRLQAAPQDATVDDVPPMKDAKEKVAYKARPFPMRQVRLAAGPFKDAMDVNVKVLHELPSDRLLHTFRTNAGLNSTAQPLGGWERPSCELRGHFTGGHYLSACALAYASTGDSEIKDKAGAMVEVLAECQKAHHDGYLSAFPESFFDRLRDGQRVWAPFYTLHKIMAGHLDMYTLCGNRQALDTAKGMARWVGKWTEGISDEQMERILGTEQGGMLEVLCNLYAVTGDDEFMWTARRFYHRPFFDPLAAHRDELKGLHANTNIPKVIGAARYYELTGDPKYHEIAAFFWNTVTHDRAYCTGGTSNHEFWRTAPAVLSTELDKDTEECCCGYNMLKLTHHIFGWTAEAGAMDYYERTLFNSRLGTQHADNGSKSYFLPLGAGYWKYFNSQYDSFWCCTGTGVEEFAKFTDSIYFHDDHGVYVNLFIASELDWPEKGVKVRQQTRFPEEEGTTLLVSAPRPTRMALRVRVPYWAAQGGSVKLNGEALPAFSSPGSYLIVEREWRDGDRLEVKLPMSLHSHPIPDDHSQEAVMYGPLVLAGRLGGGDKITPAMTYPGYDTTPSGEGMPAPPIHAAPGNPAAWVKAKSGEALAFQTAGQYSPTELIPLYRLYNERYVVYWKLNA